MKRAFYLAASIAILIYSSLQLIGIAKAYHSSKKTQQSQR